jgi:hypothetical protein
MILLVMELSSLVWAVTSNLRHCLNKYLSNNKEGGLYMEGLRWGGGGGGGGG